MTGTMHYDGYVATHEWDNDHRLFHGIVINTRAVLAFQGGNIDELRASFAGTIAEYAEWCHKQGKEPERPYSGNSNTAPTSFAPTGQHTPTGTGAADHVHWSLFTAEQVESILKEAAPIPYEKVEYWCPFSGMKLDVCRSEMVIRRLHEVRMLVDMREQVYNDMAISDVEETFNVIAASADRILSKIKPIMSIRHCDFRQISNGLHHYADKHARHYLEDLEKFPNHIPSRWRMGDTDGIFDGGRLVIDCIEGVELLRDWAKQAARSARREIEGGDNGEDGASPYHSDIIHIDGTPRFKRSNDPKIRPVKIETQMILRQIINIWTNDLGREVGTSFDTMNNKATGPMVRFCFACLQALGLGDGLTLGAVRTRIQRICANPGEKKPEARI